MTEKIVLRREFEHGHVGRYLIVPHELGSEAAVNFVIEDVYEIEYVPELTYTFWLFKERKKTYTEPHASKKEFKECTHCKSFNRKYGKIPDPVIIVQRVVK